MDEIKAEFSLFISAKSHGSQLAQHIHACFTTNRSSSDVLKAGDCPPGTLQATCCCASGEEQSDDAGHATPKHSNHFILIRVTREVLMRCAASLRPDMKDDLEGLQRAVDSLTPGQTSWLAELAIRSYQFPTEAFDKVLQLLGKPSHRTRQISPCLFTLQRWGLVADLVLRHDKPTRRELFRHNYRSFHWFPDFEALRTYLGDSVGFYFSWMRTYSLFLLAPTLIGLLRSLVTLIVYSQSDLPEHTRTDMDASSGSLIAVRLTYTLFMIFWALVCTKLWARQHETLVESWSRNPLLERTANDMAWLFAVLDQRPAFHGSWRQSRVTGMWELHFPARKRRWRYLISGLVTAGCLCVAGLINVLLLNLEGYMSTSRSSWLCFECISQFAQPGAIFDPEQTGICPYLPGVMHSLLVFIMNQVIFRRIAELLTDYENHQTYEEYDRALIVKRFLFELVDAYGCLAYLGFVLADRTALRSLLMTMLMTDSVRRLLLECLIPLVQYRLRVWHRRRAMGLKKRQEEDAGPWASLDRDTCADEYEQFDDYLEMVLQHGYLVVFAFVSPSLAAPVALVSTILEAHFDAFKLLWITKRPLPRLLVRQSSVWLALLAAQAWLSILTNVGLWIASLQMVQLDLGVTPSLLYLLLEHLLVAAGLAIHFGISDTPAHVRDARRARDLQRTALFSTPVIAM